jgi:uncharacterized membrane protein
VSVGELWQRAAIGPIPGEVVVACGILYNAAFLAIALTTNHLDRQEHRSERGKAAMG